MMATLFEDARKVLDEVNLENVDKQLVYHLNLVTIYTLLVANIPKSLPVLVLLIYVFVKRSSFLYNRLKESLLKLTLQLVHMENNIQVPSAEFIVCQQVISQCYAVKGNYQQIP